MTSLNALEMLDIQIRAYEEAETLTAEQRDTLEQLRAVRVEIAALVALGHDIQIRLQ